MHNHKRERVPAHRSRNWTGHYPLSGAPELPLLCSERSAPEGLRLGRKHAKRWEATYCTVGKGVPEGSHDRMSSSHVMKLDKRSLADVGPVVEYEAGVADEGCCSGCF